MFSIIILTLNEEKNLPLCISSASECDDIVILDSGSSDKTVDIATAAGAKVYTRPFDNFSNQRNWAHDNIRFKYNWVFHLDADERMTPELAVECCYKAATSDSSIDGFFVAPRMLWRGVWVPRSTDFPTYQARFVHYNRFRFVQSGHGQREHPKMKMETLISNYNHEMCADGIDNWLQKHKRYARQEAERHFVDKTVNTNKFSAIFSRNSLMRRRALKHFSYMIPARPLARFIYQYFFRLGILDGIAGLEYCLLLAQYEGFASKELRHLRQSAKKSV